MGVFSRIARMFNKPAAKQAVMSMQGPTRVQVVEVERFAAAQTHRLNRAHWAKAHGNSINNDLASQLGTLQARCALEYSDNPLFEGVCNTFRDDVVGRDGPTLQVVSDNEKFNDTVEAAFRAVFADPDPSHRYGGVEVMKTWVLGLLNAGSYVNINANVQRTTTPVTFGWKSIHARRLVTPPEFVGDQNVAFGCRSDEDGAPIEYYVDTTPRNGPFFSKGLAYKAYKAAQVQHVYLPVEAEQLTGYPMMSSTLETAADLRDYEGFVMDAAKNAAANSLTLQATDPRLATQMKPITATSLPFSRGEANVAPPGYNWGTVDATQPAATYKDYRRERATELGRPIHMPGLVVLLSAAEANFSTAQYEGTVYCDGVKNVQGLIERRSLIPFVLAIITELVLRGKVEMPTSFELVWTWNVPAHANIEKFVKAVETMVKLGIIAPNQASGMLGQNWDKVVAARKKCAEDLEKAGLPPTPTDSTPEPPEDDDSEPGEKGSEKKSETTKPRSAKRRRVAKRRRIVRKEHGRESRVKFDYAS